MSKYTLLSLFAVAIVLTLGCGGDGDRLRTYPATVTVLVDGKAIEGATLSLQPVTQDSEINNPGSRGITDADGKAVISTYDTGDGIPPGEYRVGVKKIEQIMGPDPTEEDPDGMEVIDEKFITPRKYASVTDSGLTLTFTEDKESNNKKLDLKSD